MIRRFFFLLCSLALSVVSLAACTAVLPTVAPMEDLPSQLEQALPNRAPGASVSWSETQEVEASVVDTSISTVYTFIPGASSNSAVDAGREEVSTEPFVPNSQPADAAEEVERDYIVNENTRKFHYPDCFSAAEISPENRREYFGTRSALLAQEYSPCENCYP